MLPKSSGLRCSATQHREREERNVWLPIDTKHTARRLLEEQPQIFQQSINTIAKQSQNKKRNQLSEFHL